MNGSSGHDEARLDAVAVYALGALPATEARELAAHIADCAECAAEYAALRGPADLIGYAAETPQYAPNELQSARMKSNLMRSVRGASSTPARTAVADVSSTSAERRRAPWLAYLAAAACLAVAFLSTFQLSNVRAQHEKDVEQVALLHAELDRQEHVANDARGRLALAQTLVADLVSPGAERYQVQRGLVARSNGRIIIALQHLPALPKGKVYQAWTLRRGAKAVAPSITFTPDASGLAIIELPESAADLAAVAMSVEPVGGSKAPTSTPAFVRPLS
jgi:anti-sigma-K factor RskA